MVQINENLLEAAIGLIVIPWVTYITVSIFSLKQQLAVMKSELSILREIKKFLMERKE